MKVIFDIESNTYHLDQLTRLHCIALKRLGVDDDVISFTDHAVYAKRHGTIADAIEILNSAATLIGHNIQAFDIPALRIFNVGFEWVGQIRDTIIMSRLQRGHDMFEHGLGAWGRKLKFPKGDFGEQNGWDTWSPEMQLYCEQDVRLNHKVYLELLKDDFPDSAIDLEHEFAHEIHLMTQEGVPFNVEAAESLATELVKSEAEQREAITRDVKPFVDESVFIPKVNNKTRGYVKGVPCIKRKETPFNCGSRTQVVRYLKETYGWEPTVFTDTGNPSVSGDVLRDLPYDIAPTLAQYFDTTKLLGMLLKGKVAWLTSLKEGRIHGKVNHNGAITGRCTHSSPNLAQVPSVGGFKGEECRSLFYAPQGYKIVGCDASGLELRNLAHYMFDYDGGDYANEVVDGDIHTKNQEAAGLETRPIAKRFIYAHNYGAGDELIGSIVDPTASPAMQKAIGAETKARFRAGLPALHTLITLVQNVAKTRGYIIGLDGRKLQVHSSHVALNVLLQGAGSVFMKKATVLTMKEIRAKGLKSKLILHVHDELQQLTKDEHAQEVAEICERNMRLAGEFYNYNLPMAGEAKIGMTWAETH